MKKRIIAMIMILVLVVEVLPVLVVRDVSAAGIKMENPRILNEVSTWDCVYFGKYWQNDTNGDGVADKNDEKMPIKWRVLSVDGDDAFLLADKCLDTQAYNSKRTAVTWEKSSLRSWLNTEFIDTAFSMEEKTLIKDTNVKNDGNTEEYAINATSTVDKVYLLSVLEIISEEYGFSKALKEMTENRIAYNTPYAAEVQGAWNNDDNVATWYLRTPVNYFGLIPSTATVSYGGQGVVFDGMHSVTDVSAIRPALHIDLSNTSKWTYAGTVSSNGKTTLPVNGDITVQTPLKNSITTRELFEKYPEYLYESPQQKVMEMILEDCEDVNGNRTWAQNMQSGYKYMLSGNSINSILKLGASELGGTSIQDEYLDEATLRFLKEIMQQSDIVESTIKEVKKDYKWAKELETKTKELSSMEIQKLLAKSGHYSDKEIGLLIKKIGENWEEIDKVFKNVGYAIDMSEAALLIVTLESVQKSLIKNLLEEVKRTAPGSDVERGLTRALEQASHPYKTVVDKYLQKGCLQAIAKTVEKKGESLVELVVGTGSAGLVFCAESACKVIAYILPESSADDVINAQNDTNFFRVLNTCVSRKTRDFIYNKQNEGDLNIDEEISNYKLLYKAELAAAKNACNSCEKIAKNHMKNIIGNDSVFLNEFSYEKHIKGCKAKVNAMLNAKYTYKRFEDELSVNGLVEENKISETSLRHAVYSDEDELMETDDVVDNGILTIPNTTEGMSVISISDNAFKDNTEIECVIVPDGVKKIGKAAFKNCSSLKRVVLGDSVEKIDEEAFAGCSSLEIVFCPDSLQQIETNAIDNSTVTLMGTESSVAIEYAKKNNISYAITEKQVSSISISKMPEKTEYSAGEKLNETDMQLCVTFMDGTETIVTEGWYSFAYKDVNGNNKVHVTYGGASTEYQISIVSEQGIYEVICEDENGVDVADSLTYTAVVGETIGVSAPNVDGYEVISTEAKKDIWVKEDITKVVFQYRRCDTNNLKNAILKMTSDTFEYTGTEIIPDVVVTLNGRELVDGTDYERIALNNVDVGTGIMIISGIGNYDGIFIKEYEITRKKDSFPEQTMKPESNESVVELVQKPSNVAEPMVVNKDKKRTISKVKGFSAKNKKRKRIVLKWKKVSEAQGYQIQYTTKKKASKQKVKNTKKTKYVLTKLKNKVYYVRVRAYRMENGKKIYSQWSVIKKIRVKK